MFRPIILSLALIPVSIVAQDFRATLQGQITDPSGAAVPDVLVKATQQGTNALREVRSTSDGVYTIPYLDPGTYDVEAIAPGFQTVRRSNITLRVSDKVNLGFQLTVGQVTQEVTITAQQEVLETASADRGLVFDALKTREYPLNGRQTYMLLALTPGVVFTQEQFGASGFSGTRGWDVNSNYKINGARTGQNLFLLNGAPISDQNGMWQLAPNVEAVEEFKVMTNTYDASYGRFGGGVVNTTLRSGSNEWHGNVFEFFRNRVFDANSFQNNLTGAPRGFHNQHQFGGVVGGPIRKDKDMVFFSFEGWQEVVPFPALSSVPPTLLRDGQHFTEFGYRIFDPLTRRLCGPPDNCAGQAYISDPFPGNVIPQNRISPIGAKILSYYPLPNTPNPLDLNNNFVAKDNLGRYYYNQPMGRWDHVAGSNDKFNLVVTYQKGYEFRSTTGFPKPAATGNTDNRRINLNYIANWTHVVSPTTVVDVRASYGRFTQITPGYNDEASEISSKDIGMTNMIHAPTYKDAVPAITASGYGRLFAGDNAISQRVDNQINFTPSVNMTRGRHNIRTGFEFNYVARGETSSGAAAGLFDFNAGWTQQRSGNQQNTFDGSTVASILLGYPASGRINYNDTSYRTRPYFAGYIQDDWKVNQLITLNLGFRYDVQVPWLERFDRSNRGFDPFVKNPLSDQVLAQWTRLKAEYDAANPNAKYPYPDP
ncbi:MAG TPA: carboxypeptidase regulatory-like domain-containing protein, partial [Bryobacteraceae bacterium]|nr:carboxypeptidase regulatory-like domain-containing protein [Bryobacteraceae bacterium]